MVFITPKLAIIEMQLPNTTVQASRPPSGYSTSISSSEGQGEDEEAELRFSRPWSAETDGGQVAKVCEWELDSTERSVGACEVLTSWTVAMPRDPEVLRDMISV